jgi:uncharacterized protein YodC (DUF2158 family)
MNRDKVNKGDLVKHRLNKMKMIVVQTEALAPCKVECRWYNDKEDMWKTDFFMAEELIIFKTKDETDG